jgi:hypothetical protein
MESMPGLKITARHFLCCLFKPNLFPGYQVGQSFTFGSICFSHFAIVG